MLNPDKNLYSVAPVGSVVVIGRHAVLRGGLPRDKALNLIAWLVLATEATQTEIGAVIADASVPTTRYVAPVVPVATELQEILPFVGRVDAEERAAIDAAARTLADGMNSAGVKEVDGRAIAKAWGQS